MPPVIRNYSVVAFCTVLAFFHRIRQSMPGSLSQHTLLCKETPAGRNVQPVIRNYSVVAFCTVLAFFHRIKQSMPGVP